MTLSPSSSSLAAASTYAHPRPISPSSLHPQLGSWTPLDLVHCSNRKLDEDFFSSRSLSIHKRIVIRNFLSFLFELQPLNHHHNDSTALLQLNLHPPSNGFEYDDDDRHDHGHDQWMEQTLSAAGVTSPCSSAAPSLTPSEGGLDSSVLEWMNSSDEPILSRSAAAAASAVTSRRRPQSLRSSRIPLPRPQSTELPQSLQSYLSAVFDVDWSIKSPTMEDALFTNKKSSSPRLPQPLYALSNLSSTLSSSSKDAARDLRASLEPELFADSIPSEQTRHGQTQDVHTGLQGRHSSTDSSIHQGDIGLCESESSSKHEEGVANDTSLFVWEQKALNQHSSSTRRYRDQLQHSKDGHEHQRQHQYLYQQPQEQHIHNHIHIHVHTYPSPSSDSEDGSVVFSYPQPPQPRSSRYPTPPPSATAQKTHQHQQKESYPCIAVAGPLAPQSSSQLLTNPSSLPQYPPEKTVSNGNDQLYFATPTTSSPEPTRSRYPRSPPPPPYTPSPVLTNNAAQLSDPLVYPQPMKRAPQAPRHMQSAAARKEYQRYEEQQKMFVRDEEPKETGSQGFLRLLTRQSSKRKSSKVPSISAPLCISQPVHWQDQDLGQSFNRLSLTSAPNTKVEALKEPLSPAKSSQQHHLSPQIPPQIPSPSTEVFSYYPSRSAPAPVSVSISTAQH
ncbi:hypothetical protein EMPS_00840 [Entomortierella parvispora]|uniref:Uncharacterized protein n=1 Tax=Entomortierella parvispora TaxID=205924 RepID=A0A9P3H1V0_9FUNG|nr:hypothetical protein EMPS_00840 [Entomortierella parvispora]